MPAQQLEEPVESGVPCVQRSSGESRFDTEVHPQDELGARSAQPSHDGRQHELGGPAIVGVHGEPTRCTKGRHPSRGRRRSIHTAPAHSESRGVRRVETHVTEPAGQQVRVDESIPHDHRRQFYSPLEDQIR